MNTNRIKIRVIGAFAMALILGMSSCADFLDQMPKTALTEEQVFTDIKMAEPAVDGLYTMFREAKAGRAGLTFQLLGLDESKQGIVQMMDAGQSGLDYYDGNLNPTSNQIDEMWTRRYKIVPSAAKAVAGLSILVEKTDPADTETLDLIKVLKGHASFVRALTMFEVAMFWGEVPVIEITDLSETKLDLARKPLDVVWKQIYDDFTYASENLPDVKQTNQRATRGAALAMLGKLFMYAPVESGYRDFDKAKGYFEQIIGKYNLDSNYANLFDEYGKCEFNSAESIFEIDYICNSQRPNYWQWDMGSRTLASLGESCYIAGYDVALPTEYAYKNVADGGVWETGDKRYAVNIRTDWEYQHVTYTVPSWGADELDPHIKKWEDRRLDKQTSNSLAVDATSGRSMYWAGKNYLLIRYADILLCYAECLNELGQTPQAIIEANKVRARAGVPAWSGLSQEQFRVNILDERMRELCFEGWRRMDLIRTGKFVELIKERNPWAKEKGMIQEYHKRYPIPNNVILLNPDIEREDQNPGYND